MSIDFSQKERIFVDELAADTGRDLDGWMAAIGEAGLSHRNDIIDWLRQKGFTFARASWLERIHHNGGKLIYGQITARSPVELHRRKPAERPAPDPQKAEPKPLPPVRSPAPPVAAAASNDGDIDVVLASAKAYRPLAQAMLRDILAAVPGADVQAQRGHIVASHSRPFAALLPGPKDVRLLLSLATRTPGPDWSRTKLAAGLDSLTALTHMLVLTDARQLTRELKELVAASARDTAD